MNKIIACASIKPELDHVKGDADDVIIKYLPQNLHRDPTKLKKILQDAIDNMSSENGKVILGFGLCSNAIVDIKAPKQGLYVPRVHDCITFYLGSREKYKNLFSKYPGTYYLTKSWINDNKDPLGLVENEYTERVGREMAEETMQQEIKNYKYISFVNTAGNNAKKFSERAKKNAKHFNKKYIEYKGNDDFFKKIVFGPHEEPDFIYVEPNEKIKQKEFLK